MRMDLLVVPQWDASWLMHLGYMIQLEMSGNGPILLTAQIESVAMVKMAMTPSSQGLKLKLSKVVHSFALTITANDSGQPLGRPKILR